MNDQAESLRKLIHNNPNLDTKVISVVSGKGGVGKSNFSLNFSLGLSRAGKKVLLFAEKSHSQRVMHFLMRLPNSPKPCSIQSSPTHYQGLEREHM